MGEDVVIEERPPPGQPPRVETFSFKSRNLAALDDNALPVQVSTDASWKVHFPTRYTREVIDGHTIPALGVYLGDVLVRRLGGL